MLHKKFKIKRNIFILLILFVISLIITSASIKIYTKNRNIMIEAAKRLVSREAVRSSIFVDKELKELMEATVSISDGLTSGKMNSDILTKQMESKLTANKNVLGIGVLYVPYAYSSNKRLHSIYFERRNGNINQVQIEKLFDYTKENWYHEISARGAFWVEPFSGVFSEETVVLFGVPFYQIDSVTKESKIAGIIIVTTPLESLSHILSSLNLGESGYAFLLYSNGAFISHPDDTLIKEHKNIYQSIAEAGSVGNLSDILNAVKGKSTIIDFFNKSTGQSSWIVFEPIKSAGWTLGAFFFKNDVNIDFNTLRHNLIKISLLVLMTAGLFFIFILFFLKRGTQLLWGISIILTILFIVEIGFIWYLRLTLTSAKPGNRLIIVDREGLNKFIRIQLRKGAGLNEEKIVKIPTGVYIDSLSFISANDVKITGYIWQKYSEDISQTLMRGFYFPDAVSHSEEKMFQLKKSNYEEWAWRFNSIIRQNFDYSTFPFDSKEIYIGMRHNDLNSSVLIIPDLDTYRLMNPSNLPGLKKEMIFPGWTIKHCFFSYSSEDEQSNISNNIPKGQNPKLNYTIILQRKFLGPFITNLLPLIVISFILFALIMSVTNVKQKADTLGYKFGSLLGACSGLFFAILIAHIGLRNTLASTGIVYLEYFYFIIYFIIILIGTSAMLFVTKKDEFKLLSYEDYLIPKLLYWPIILGSGLVITLVMFY